MPHFDLFVQTSHTEGLPNVLLEASASGTPSVATDVGGTREVLINVRTGRVVPPNDHHVLAWAIESLLTDEQNRNQLAEAGKRHINEKFNFAQQANDYENLFYSLTNQV
jgi:glycosyltransferase involved in cell wall biosynthesis